MPTLYQRVQAFRRPQQPYTPLPFVGTENTSKSWEFTTLLSGNAGAGLVGRSGELTFDKYGAAIAYMSVPAVNRAVNLIADSVDALPYKIVRNETSDKTKDETIAESSDPHPRHPLLKALRDGHNESKQSLIWLSMFSLLTYGENFLEPKPIALLHGDIPVMPYVGLGWLNALAMTVMVSGGKINSYQYTYPGGGGSHRFDPSRVVYDHTRNPFDDFRGLSKVVVAMSKVNILRDMDRFVFDYFRNNAVPDVIASPKGEDTFSDLDIQRLRDQIRNNLKGAGNQHRAFISPAAADWLQLEQADLDKQYSLNDPLTRTVFTTFGIPLSMAGDDSGTQYKAGDPVRVGFYQNTIIPTAKDFKNFINFEVMPFFDDTGYERLEFDTTEFDTVSEDDEMRSTVASTNYTGGIWTQNEARQYTKQEPVTIEIDGIDGNSFYKPPVSSIPLMNTPTGSLPDMINSLNGKSLAAESVPGKATLVSSETSESAYVYLPLPNDVNLIAIQNQLKGQLGDGVEYQDPSTFHITLVYCTSISDHDLNEIAERPIEFNPVSVLGSKLGLFDNEDEHALHIVVDESPIAGLQKAIYECFEQAGFKNDLSKFSNPKNYTAHITLAYLPGATTPPAIAFKFEATVDRFVIGRDDYKTFAVVTSAAPGKATQLNADDELRAWEKKSLKNWQAKFEPLHLKGWIGEYIHHAIATSNGDAIVLKAAFSQARDLLTENSKWTDERLNTAYDTLRVFKAYADTKEQFIQEMVSVIGAGQANETTRRGFAGSMRAALRRYGLIAYRDGMNSVGYDPESLNTKELERFRAWQDEQSGYVTNLGAEVFKQGITENEVAIRARMWADVSLRAIYLGGITTGNGKQRLMWKLGTVENHCPDCLVLNGQVHTADEWEGKGLQPGNGKTVCKQGCDCSMELTDEPVKGNWL
jgi:phage portal protein BeeE/2'-5' RNA ligase